VPVKNPPSGTHATNAIVNALQDLHQTYEDLRAIRAELSTTNLDSCERRLAGIRRQAQKLIHQLNPADTAWKRAFGLI
jgi:hypothetical protein